MGLLKSSVGVDFVTGYAKCAAGWMEDYKGYWFDRTKRGCGKKKGYRSWGKNDKAR